jgi:hypothetical protein
VRQSGFEPHPAGWQIRGGVRTQGFFRCADCTLGYFRTVPPGRSAGFGALE